MFIRALHRKSAASINVDLLDWHFLVLEQIAHDQNATVQLNEAK